MEADLSRGIKGEDKKNISDCKSYTITFILVARVTGKCLATY